MIRQSTDYRGRFRRPKAVILALACDTSKRLSSSYPEAGNTSGKGTTMARTIEEERAQLAAEAKKLDERRRQLAERERSELLKEVENCLLYTSPSPRD